MEPNRERVDAITASIPPSRRSTWVADVLRAATIDLRLADDVTQLTKRDAVPAEAAAIFHRLRTLTLQLEREGADRLELAVLLAAENAAKVIADPWGERFDGDSTGWFWLCIEDLLDARGLPSLSAAVIPMLPGQAG